MRISVMATYKLNGAKHERLFGGKGATHKNVRAYLKSQGATRIKTVTWTKIWNIRNA